VLLVKKVSLEPWEWKATGGGRGIKDVERKATGSGLLLSCRQSLRRDGARAQRVKYIRPKKVSRLKNCTDHTYMSTHQWLQNTIRINKGTALKPAPVPHYQVYLRVLYSAHFNIHILPVGSNDPPFQPGHPPLCRWHPVIAQHSPRGSRVEWPGVVKWPGGTHLWCWGS